MEDDDNNNNKRLIDSSSENYTITNEEAEKDDVEQVADELNYRLLQQQEQQEQQQEESLHGAAATADVAAVADSSFASRSNHHQIPDQQHQLNPPPPPPPQQQHGDYSNNNLHPQHYYNNNPHSSPYYPPPPPVEYSSPHSSYYYHPQQQPPPYYQYNSQSSSSYNMNNNTNHQRPQPPPPPPRHSPYSAASALDNNRETSGDGDGHHHPQSSAPAVNNYSAASSPSSPSYYYHEDMNMAAPTTMMGMMAPSATATATQATALLAVGSMLGLTAAAAVRWLNGGDFVLLPPALAATASQDEDEDGATTRARTLTLRQPQQQGQQEEHHVNYDDEDGDHLIDGAPTATTSATALNNITEDEKALLTYRVDALLNALHSQSQKQDEILNKLNRHEATKTDESMNLLKQQQSQSQQSSNHHQRSHSKNDNQWMVIAKLSQVKADLFSLKQDLMNSIFGSSSTATSPQKDSRGGDTEDEEEVSATNTLPSPDAATTGRTDSLAVEDWDKRLSESMKQLDDCLQQLQQQDEQEQQQLQQHPTCSKTASSSSSSPALPSTSSHDQQPDDNINTLDDRASALSSTPPSATASADEVDKYTTPSPIHPAANNKDDNNDSPAAKLQNSLRVLVKENDHQSMLMGAQLLYLYVVNLSTHPRVPRYRKIFTSNESFQKVNQVKGGRDLLYAVGFSEQQGGKYLVWLPTPSSDDKECDGGEGTENKEEIYLSLLEDAASALSILKSPGRKNASDDDVISRAVAGMPSLLSEAKDDGEDEKKINDGDNEVPAPPPPISPPKTKGSFQELVNTSVYQTPEAGPGWIVSPPVTKKQLVLPPDDTEGVCPRHPVMSLSSPTSAAAASSSSSSPQHSMDISTVSESSRLTNGLTDRLANRLANRLNNRLNNVELNN